MKSLNNLEQYFLDKLSDIKRVVTKFMDSQVNTLDEKQLLMDAFEENYNKIELLEIDPKFGPFMKNKPSDLFKKD